MANLCKTLHCAALLGSISHWQPDIGYPLDGRLECLQFLLIMIHCPIGIVVVFVHRFWHQEDLRRTLDDDSSPLPQWPWSDSFNLHPSDHCIVDPHGSHKVQRLIDIDTSRCHCGKQGRKDTAHQHAMDKWPCRSRSRSRVVVIPEPNQSRLLIRCQTWILLGSLFPRQGRMQWIPILNEMAKVLYHVKSIGSLQCGDLTDLYPMSHLGNGGDDRHFLVLW